MYTCNHYNFYILIKGKFHQEVIMITSIHAPTFGVPNFIKQILLGTKEQTGPDTVIMGE
jgi:adenine specific DNA methylase Mod